MTPPSTLHHINAHTFGISHTVTPPPPYKYTHIRNISYIQIVIVIIRYTPSLRLIIFYFCKSTILTTRRKVTTTMTQREKHELHQHTVTSTMSTPTSQTPPLLYHKQQPQYHRYPVPSTTNINHNITESSNNNTEYKQHNTIQTQQRQTLITKLHIPPTSTSTR